MASVIYNEFKRGNAAAEIDLNADDIRVALVMSDTTVDTENAGITTVSGFTTLDEFDGAGYARQALLNEAVNKDDPNNRAEFDADNVAWTGLGAGTRAAPGILIYKHVTDDTDSIPIAFIEFPAPWSGSGDLTINFNAEGILQLT